MEKRKAKGGQKKVNGRRQKKGGTQHGCVKNPVGEKLPAGPGEFTYEIAGRVGKLFARQP